MCGEIAVLYKIYRSGDHSLQEVELPLRLKKMYYKNDNRWEKCWTNKRKYQGELYFALSGRISKTNEDRRTAREDCKKIEFCEKMFIKKFKSQSIGT